MNTNLLQTVLNAAVEARGEPGYFIPSIELDKAEKSPDTAEPRTVAFLKALRAEPELKLFEENHHIIAGEAHTPDYKDLAKWLIRRTLESTAAQALADLATYLSAKEFECVQTVVFQGLTPEAAFEFDHCISLLPWDTFPDAAEKHRIEQDLAGHSPYGSLVSPSDSKLTGALVRRFLANIVIREKARVDRQPQPQCLENYDIRDALMCIGLIVPPVPRALGCWTKYPQWVPVFEPWERQEIAGYSPVRPFPSSSAQQAKSLFNSFLARNSDTQAHLRLVMERLSRMQREMRVDAAIDLGIALEALYLCDLSDDRGELTFRLRIRAGSISWKRCLRAEKNLRASWQDLCA